MLEGRTVLNKGTRTFLTVLLALMLTGSLGMLLRQDGQLRAAEESYAQAERITESVDAEVPLNLPLRWMNTPPDCWNWTSALCRQ